MGDVRSRWLRALFPVLAFVAVMAWFWRVSDLAHNLPTKAEYGDPLEVLWLINNAFASLSRGELPLFNPDVWHPVGIYLGALGYSPLSYLIILPFRVFSTATFALNMANLLGLALLFSSTYRFMRRFGGVFVSSVAALLFTFTPFTVERVLNGHLNILWATIFIPLMLGALMDLVVAQDARAQKRAAVWAGVWWGLLISFQLYGVWWGGLMWLLAFGVSFAKTRRVVGALALPLALLIGLPTIGVFLSQSGKAQIVTDTLNALVGWGANLNSLLIPSIFHPLEAVRAVTSAWCCRNPNEASIANWGTLLTGLGLAGALFAARKAIPKPAFVFLAMLAASAGILTLGMVVRWNDEIVSAPVFAPLNAALWQMGRLVKPALFASPQPIPEVAQAIPLPGFGLMAVLPQWEAARVYTRFYLLTGLALTGFAALVLQRLRWGWRVGLAALLLIEALPLPTFNRPTPTAAHPAYEWLAANAAPGMAERAWNILNISDEPNAEPIMLGGLPTYSASLSNVAIAQGFGSYPVRHIVELRNILLHAPDWATDMRIPFFMRNLKIGYVFVHLKFKKDSRVWDGVRASPFFTPQGCFASQGEMDVWQDEICVAKANWLDRKVPNIDLIPSFDWSPEGWGIWAIAKSAKANWVAPRAGAYRLQARAFPACVAGRGQAITARVNGQPVGQHAWQDCAEAELNFIIPANAVRAGWNELVLESAYTERIQGDTRTLAVGFSEIKIIPLE